MSNIPKLHNQREAKYTRKLLRNNSTNSETLMWQALCGKQIGYKFRRQHGIGPFIVDFYCPELKLVIELDGETHTQERVLENDKRKEQFCVENGLRIARFTDEEVFGNPETVLNKIRAVCQEIDNS